ncbi:ABC transporter substrate-binding protein [Streptomyces sp. NPDC002130]|uniref:ABC transporter substrate-binding protein n=1 Tax=Streptomyces sp. NPDC002130 TaxID=3155568 RepID=UPI0033188D36
MPAEPAACVTAFDSMPGTLGQPGWCDHSGLQLAALTTRPLVAPGACGPEPTGARSFDTSADGRRHDFALRPGARWADGSPVTADDYARALDRAVASATVTGYWLRHVEQVSSRGDRLRVRLGEPDHGFPLLTSLPALAPYRTRTDGVGRYRIVSTAPRTIVLDRTPHTPGGPSRVVLRRVKSPERNLEGFAAGRLDVTSDTAFPLHRVAEFAGHPSLRVRRTGIVVALCFEGELLRPEAERNRHTIRDALTAPGTGALLPAPLLPQHGFLPVRDFDRAFRDAARSTAPAPVHSPRGPARARYRLAYDTYYPNRELARAAAQMLAAAGIRADLVPDRYENRSRTADLRLNLFRGLRSDPLGVYRGLVFLEALRTHDVLESYLKVLQAYDSAPQTPASLDATVAELDGILARHSLCVPLAEVPGIFLARQPKAPWEWS